MTTDADLLRPSRQDSSSRPVALWLAATAVAGGIAALVGPIAVAFTAAAGLIGWTAWRPVVATYIYIGTLPLVAGIERDALLPLLRPNEALLVLLVVGVSVSAYSAFISGRPLGFRPAAPDLPLAAFLVLATLWPIVSLMLRGHAPEVPELLALLPAVKLAGLFVLVRMTVRTATELLRCVRLVIWGAAAVSVIALLQTLSVGPVLSFLSIWWGIDAELPESSSRGTATLGNSLATGDYILIGLILLVTVAVRGLIGRREGLVLGVVLAPGLLAAGQFSTWLAALVAGGVILCRSPEMRRQAIRFLPAAVLPLILGAPAVLSRVQGIGGELGVPQSWLVRWDNVTYLYLPRLAEDLGFLIGVSPESTLLAPDIWRDLIWIESGYLQFLWVGGVPLLAGFVCLSVAVLRHARALCARPDALGACGSCLEVAWGVLLLVSVLDPHLYLRGSGDLFFILLALTTGGVAARPQPDGAPTGHQ